jgi:hypothetical protein
MNMPFRCWRAGPWLLLLFVPWVGGGCDRTDPCRHSSACPPPAVCQPDGTCRPGGGGSGEHGHRRILTAHDWAIEHGDGTPALQDDVDLLPLGGPRDAIAHLSFGPLPQDTPEITEAVVTLSPHPSWHGSTRPWRVAALAGKDPAEVRARRRPRLEWTPEVHVVRMRTGVQRPLRIDVAPLVRAAVDEGRDRVHVALRVLDRHAEALSFASPRAQAPARRPRLTLVPHHGRVQ